MSSNRSNHVISFEKTVREEKSSEYVHPFGGHTNAQCPLCKSVFVDCGTMYQHVAKHHPLTASSTLLPGRSFSIPGFKRKLLGLESEVVCIICRRSMHKEKYADHILWSHPWILDKDTLAIWENAREKLTSTHEVDGRANVPDSLTYDEDKDCVSIGDMLAGKGACFEREKKNVEEARVNKPPRTVSVSESFSTSPALPSLPNPITLAGLISYLATLGFEVDNKRGIGGGLWVYRSRAEFGRVAEHLERSGVGLRFYPEGRKNRPGEQWEIDPKRKLD